MKTPFANFFGNVFKKKATPKITTNAPQPVAATKNVLEHFIPKKVFHAAPVMQSKLDAIKRAKRNKRNQMQKLSRRVNFGLA